MGTFCNGPSAGAGETSCASHRALSSDCPRATTELKVAQVRTTIAGSPGPRVIRPMTSPPEFTTGAPRALLLTELDNSIHSSLVGEVFFAIVLSITETFPLPNGLSTIATFAPGSTAAVEFRTTDRTGSLTWHSNN